MSSRLTGLAGLLGLPRVRKVLAAVVGLVVVSALIASFRQDGHGGAVVRLKVGASSSAVPTDPAGPAGLPVDPTSAPGVTGTATPAATGAAPLPGEANPTSGPVGRNAGTRSRSHRASTRAGGGTRSTGTTSKPPAPQPPPPQPAPAPAPAVTVGPAGRPQAQWCGFEGRTCRVPGFVTVFYGTDRGAAAVPGRGSFRCSWQELGLPRPRTSGSRSCWYSVPVDCGTEGQFCQPPPGMTVVAYYQGDGGLRWRTGVSGAFACRAADFGVGGGEGRCSITTSEP